MLDALPQLMMGLVILMVVSFIGLTIADKAMSADEFAVEAPAPVYVTVAVPATAIATPATVAAVAATPAIQAEVEQTVNDAFGWMPLLIVAVVGGVVLSLVVGLADMGGGFESPPARPRAPEPIRVPARSAPVHERLYWDPYQQRTSPVLVPPGIVAPVPVAPPEPTTADLIDRDPEIVALRGSITETDEELARIRAERRQQLDGHGQLGRALLWFRRRFHRESAT